MKIRDFAAHFFFENRRLWTKIRDFAAVTGYAPRAARGAQWRVLSGSKTRHIIHSYWRMGRVVGALDDGCVGWWTRCVADVSGGGRVAWRMCPIVHGLRRGYLGW